jgi:preprotein translocase subunit SecG
MAWIIGILTVILVIDCLFLALLILVQLPKKEAGLGQAFGGAATDALFGAGSGSALTKLTKYSAGIFFLLTFSLSILNAQQSRSGRPKFERDLQRAAKEAEAAAPVPAVPPAATVAATAAPSALLTTTVTTPPPTAATSGLLTTITNVAPRAATSAPPAAPPTNAAPKPATEKK